MDRTRTIKIFLSALIVALSLTITVNPVLAATTSTPLKETVKSSPNLSQEKLQDKVEDAKSKLEDNVEDTLVSEAQEAVKETQKAIAAIEEGNKRKALKALESATGKLDLVLARQPELGLVSYSRNQSSSTNRRSFIFNSGRGTRRNSAVNFS